MVHLIKKYANRKLYHTNQKHYITLDGIGELIQRGEDVQVVDNETGDDITATILAQVVLQARGRKSALPTHLLTDLIQAGGDRLAGLSRSVFSALGALSPVDAEIVRRLDQLREHGTINAAEAARLERLLVHGPEPEAFAGALHAVPSAQDVARLNAQVDALTVVVEQLLAERDARVAPPPA